MKCVLALSLILALAFAAGPGAWQSRTIYQLLTDRFGVTSGSPSCANIGDYCGGSWQGIINHLDYIQGMGFDAIWISPIPENYPGGYHGYWQTNFEEINSNFGSVSDLSNLVQECHNRNMWVMLDVVANHVGPVNYDYSTIVPLNQDIYYHPCTTCPSNCQIQDWSDQPEVEECRLAGLPDLDQSNIFVNSTLVKWVYTAITTFGFDGIRIDTVPEVDKSFWYGYISAAGVYSVGEVFNGDIGYVAGYVKPQGPLDGSLSYPLFFTLRSVFASQQSMYQLQTVNQQYASNFGNGVNLLGTFLDNHDNARFLNVQSDYQLYKNALVYTLYSTGIPIIYYGTEQGFNGGNDPDNREILWPTSYNNQTVLYEFLQLVINYRKTAQVWSSPQVQRYADDTFYAFTRGTTFIATTNVGSSGSPQSRTITYHPYANGTKLCNLFFPTTDCLTVTNGQFGVYLEGGECKIYYVV